MIVGCDSRTRGRTTVNLDFLLFINATVIQNVLEGVIGVTLGSGGWLAGAAVVVVKVVRESAMIIRGHGRNNDDDQ